MKQMKDSGLTPQKKKASDIFLEPNYTIQKITIDKNNISTFFPLTWMRRDIRKNQVNSILRGLREKQHFDVPLVLMQHNGDQYRYIIDGNHRMEAIKHFLKIEDNEFNDNAIDVYSIIYEKLNKDEIRKIYAVWNTGIRQNTDDYIMAFKETIPMFNKIVTELPCDVYGNRDRLKFKHFVGGYFAAKYEGMFQGGFSGSAMDFVDQSKKLTEKDVEVIVEFWNDFITAFALPVHQQNMRTIPHVKTSPFYAIFRVWYLNRKHPYLNKTELLQRLGQGNMQKDIETWAPRGGRESCREAFQSFIEKMNFNITTPNKLIRTDPIAIQR